jgi:hypothetical protein
MEPFKPLSMFYDAITEDARIGTSHISLYMALLQQWNRSGGKNPVIFDRASIMKAAKINARYTYNRCINNLHEYGYIIYYPATNSFEQSTVILNGLGK